MTTQTADFRNLADAMTWKRTQDAPRPRSLLEGATMESVQRAWAEFRPVQPDRSASLAEPPGSRGRP
jgi:hypothetical protein